MKGKGLVAADSAASLELVSSFTGRILVRVYGRLGTFYPLTVLALQLLSGYVIAAFAVVIASRYLVASNLALLKFAGVVGVLVTVGYFGALVRGYLTLRPVKRWLKGQRDAESTRSAWQAAIALPAFYLRTPLRLIFGVALPFAVAGYLVLSLSLGEAGALMFGACVGVSYAGVLDYFSLEGLMRPVVADIAAALPRRSEAEARGVSVRAKLLVALPAINVITAITVATLISPEDHLTDLVVDVLIATGVALSLSLLLVMRVTSAMVRPIGDLQRGLDLVEEGRLDVVVPVTSGDEIGELAAAFNRMVAALADRERIREVFGTFVDRDVADHILGSPGALAGEEVDVTVMFLDVRGFTGFAETAAPTEVVERLNRLFELVVPFIAADQGQVDKFIGDGLMAVFGAPRALSDHADRALAAACAIAAAVEAEFGDELRIGIGLNSGPVVAGSIGAAERLNYSVIGDAVNVAARVEAATRETGDVVLLTEQTCALLADRSALERRGEVSLKGRAEPVVVYSP
ncbi:MAG: adenylate cyclase [Thermoleophilaceae bacterium]|jgi:class 3 adenylate cyclase|nr:adenylate cyclase [Thermoleophilaceae bacterium]